MKEKTSVTISKEVLKGIDRLAGSSLSRSALIERILRKYLHDRSQAAVRARDLERINAAADRLNREAAQVLDCPYLDEQCSGEKHSAPEPL
jgi:metal-responsive CopG/Arc/MetJ family transcriptional regulator